MFIPQKRGKTDRSKISGILIFSSVVVVVFFVFVLGNIITNGEIFENFFFYDRADTGMDFFNSVIYVCHKTPYTQYSVVYPPLANLFFYIFACMVPDAIRDKWAGTYIDSVSMRRTALDLRTSQYTLFPFFLYVAFSTLLLYWISKKSIKGTVKERNLFAFSILCTTGSLLSLEHGNIVILAALMCCFFIRFKDSNNRWLSELALVSLAIAAGLKVYPAFLGIFLIVDKQYKKAFRAVIYGLICLFLPFWAFEGSEGIQIFFNKLLAFSDSSSKASISGFSLQQIVKPWLAIFAVNDWGPFITCTKWIGYGVLFFSMLLSPFVSRWKAIGLVTMAMYMFPGKISSGTIIYLIVPLTVFLSQYKMIGPIRNWYLILYLLILVPIPFPNSDFFSNLSIGYSLNTFVMQTCEALLLLTYLFDCFFESLKYGLKRLYIIRKVKSF